MYRDYPFFQARIRRYPIKVCVLDFGMILHASYCPASQEWQWRNALMTILKWNTNVYR